MAGVAGRVALVTGAGAPGGIGFATARVLAAAGARVAITSTTQRIFDRARSLGSGVYASTADLRRPEEVARLVAETEVALGPVDILVNNAGMVQTGIALPGGHLTEIDEAAWAYGIEINLTSAMRLTRAILPGMCARGFGRVVQMSSVTGPVVAIAGSATYAAAKAGLMGRARSGDEGGNGDSRRCRLDPHRRLGRRRDRRRPPHPRRPPGPAGGGGPCRPLSRGGRGELCHRPAHRRRWGQHLAGIQGRPVN